MNKSAEKTAHDREEALEPRICFEGVRHLYGEAAFDCFQKAHVCIIGVGGVGSWAVEALARSGIGNLTLIDPDCVAPSNKNRQIQALQNTMGKSKISVLAERIRQINAACRVREVAEKVTLENPQTLLGNQAFDYVIDAIDDMFAKTALIAWCRENGIPLVTVGGAGGQTDPTQIAVCDLCRTEQEPLLARVRKRLRQKYGFPRGLRPFGIDAVYSTEPLRYPEGVSKALPDILEERALAETDSLRFGTSVTVTASFGMVAASVVLRRLAENANRKEENDGVG
ncbi:tRNA threonylcarbamoyladenosine dehydratase [Oxalobacter vibrioformis]|uniref:tRNA threonylcarbamoyladenosine dehydratase n=1 Tax=Oxalobacter vibrioformis TaxID=933080 RepID=A0A9E9LVH0_9BURK|nr:tRNA threonylcarbamoyladenosine dehydratase [Oxalobacter vibrioformis]WAW10475.1 tRNA threonylcarbamoyladenosine dehydratase [Oxalobacter vibrioformis]